MNIKINDKYRLTSDNYQFVLQKRRVIEDKESKNYGVEQFDTVGYYASIAGALKGYARKEMLDSDAETLLELRELQEELFDTIEELTRGLDIDTRTNN